MKRRTSPTLRVDLPASMVDMMERRTDDLVRACMHEPNIIRAIALSCYGQGLQDALQVIEHHPTRLTLVDPSPVDEVPID